MGCGSSAQKKVVAQPQPVATPAQQTQNATKAPAAAAPPAAAPPAPAPAPKPAAVQTPVKNVTPDAPPKPMALDLGDEPIPENEALAGKLYSPKAVNQDAPVTDLMRQQTNPNAQDMLMGDLEPSSKPALMENAALDGKLYSPRAGGSNQDDAPIDLMGPSAPPAAEVLDVAPDGGESSVLLENAALEGALYSPRAGQEKGPKVDLMGGGGSELDSTAKKDLVGAEDGYEAPLMENLALDGALYSRGGSPPPGGAGQEKQKELVAAHEEGSTVMPNAALRGELYSPRGGGEDKAPPDMMGGGGEGKGVPDLMGGGVELDAETKESLRPPQGTAPALMENAALAGALFSPRAGEAEEKKDVMGGGGGTVRG